MELRWIVLCDKNGRKTKPDLQFWNEDDEIWEDVPYVEMKTWEYDPKRKDQY